MLILKPTFSELALDPHCRFLVRLPADAHGEVERDRLRHAGLLHQRLGLVDIKFVGRQVPSYPASTTAARSSPSVALQDVGHDRGHGMA